MAIKIKGNEYDPTFELTIKEKDISSTFVHISKEFYKAKATLNTYYGSVDINGATINTYYGSVDINGATLHNIVKEMLIQNKGFRSVITDYIDQLDAEDEGQDLSTLN